MKAVESISELKVSLAQRLLSLEDEVLLAQVAALLRADSEDWWEELDEEDRAAIARADEDITANRLYTHDQIKEDLNSWLHE